jgi:glycosyltransferase involved in cell wall biosynthesis/SAM-dependent methyltransferase
MPKVSVIIPSYNHEKYVAETIQSVLDQTYQDFEIVITDDGSTDGTVAEIRKFTDPRIRLFVFEKNQGASVAVNKCIAEAKGEYVALINSDDVFVPHKLEEQVKFLDEHPKIVAVFGYAQIIDEDGHDFTDKSHFYYNVFTQPNRTRYEWLNHFFYHGNCLCHPSVLIRKFCYNEVGLFNPRYANIPDFDFWIRLCMKYEIYIIPENLVKFRILKNTSNVSVSKPETVRRYYFELLQVMRNYLKIEEKEDLLRIFPELSKYDTDIDDDLIPYFIARLALDLERRPVYHFLGIEILSNMLADNKLAEKLESQLQFTFRDFIKITGEYDSFNIVEMRQCAQKISETQTKLSALEQQLPEKDQQLAQLDKQAAELSKKLDSNKQELGRLRQRLTAVEKQNAEKAARIDDLVNSLSWKVTRPLRFLYGFAMPRNATVTKFATNLLHVMKTYNFRQAIPNIRRYGLKTFLDNARKEFTRGSLTYKSGGQSRRDRSEKNRKGDATYPHGNVASSKDKHPTSTGGGSQSSGRQSKMLEVEEKYYFDLSSEPIGSTPIKLIAFYLPQFHCIPENDKWWGEGFTEWTNTRRSRPLFDGHHQPRTPTHLGYYSLDTAEVYAEQVKLAKKAGIYGFCFYFYWFAGKTLLEKPLLNMLAHPDIDQPFCLCWANENWTRRWDGQENEILISQEHSKKDATNFLDHINVYFKDERYIKIDGKPVLVVYRPGIIPNITRIQKLLRTHAEELGWPGLYLVSAQTFGQKDPQEFEFDAAAQFPPHNQRHKGVLNSKTPGLVPEFKGRIFDYRNLSRHFCDGVNPDYVLFRGVTLGWDNTARNLMHAMILRNFSLASYAQWLSAACQATLADPHLAKQEKFVFINAWNEWAEGTYLEPDSKYGFGYLEATRKALIDCAGKRPRISVIVPNYNHAAFIGRRLASIVGQTRRPDEIIFLDDASSDDSVMIARDLLARSNIRFSIIRNEGNSGNVFRQWIKGIEIATGDLIWITESDDEAAPDFLAKITPQFEREDVLLAYGDISYINADSTPNAGLVNYYDGLRELDWSRSHVVTASRAFGGPFAVKNIIPNVSGAVFRKPFLTTAEKDRLTSYTFAGDWYFYALISRGGSIAFCKEAKSFFRLHTQSTSRKVFFSERHINEHKMVLQDLHEVYNIGQKAIQRHVEELLRVLRLQSPEISRGDVTSSMEVITPERRYLRVCIASYSFCVGGGEVVPIDIANALRALGHHVTFFVLYRDLPDEQPVLRPRLRGDIPVVYWDDVRHTFRAFLEDHGIEIFNSHNVGIEWELYRSGLSLGVPYIASLHGGYETVPKLLTKEFISYVRTTVAEWLYLSDKNIEPLRRRGLTDALFTKSFNISVPRAPNIGHALDIRKSLEIDKDGVLLVLASRALYEKGWQLAVDTTQKLRESTGIDFRLLLIGDGPDLNALKTSNADKVFVTFLGRIDNPFPIISECDIGIFPSTYAGESFPLFILECLQYGLPVIATDIGEISEIMNALGSEIPGQVVSRRGEKELVEDMAEAILTLVNDNGKMRAAKQQAIKLAQHFSIDKLIELYLEVFYRQSFRSLEEEMIFRDPNTLYKINNIVGSHDFTEERGDRLLLRGQIHPEAVTSFALDQIVIQDLSDRYVTGVSADGEGKWSAEIARSNLGNDNSCLELKVFAAGRSHNYIFPLQSTPAAVSAYQRFIKPRLPENSKDVPSINKELRELIIKATRVPYVSRSIHQSITTGNNYQTLFLDDTLRRGGRPPRERFLRQIDFRGKTVLDVGANTGENSRIVRKLGASLVDGYEYDPYFVEIGRAINAYAGMTRISLFQGDCTRAEVFQGMKYDVVMALAVWVYIEDTIKQIAEITDILVFETHTLDHGIEFYYQPVLKYFPHIISLGYTEKPADPHQSRMFIVFGKDKAAIERILDRKFLKVKPYFNNKFIKKYSGLTKAEVLDLAKHCYEKHSGRTSYDKEEYVYGTDTYFEVFLAGLHQFAANGRKIENLVTADNLYLSFLKKGIESKILDQKLKNISENTEWMVRKVSNKYEDALNILDGHIDRLAPVEIVPEANGQLTFTSTTGENYSCEIFDGHHRFFMLELVGAEKIHFVVNNDDSGLFSQRFTHTVQSNYTLKIQQ